MLVPQGLAALMLVSAQVMIAPRTSLSTLRCRSTLEALVQVVAGEERSMLGLLLARHWRDELLPSRLAPLCWFAAEETALPGLDAPC